MMPQVENPNGLSLSDEVQQVLSKIFRQYKRIILRQIFQEGLSGSRVIEVQPIQVNGTPELPAVVKVAAISLIQKEWQAYRQHIRFRLHNAASVTAEPILVPEIGWGGIRYTLMGGGAFEVTTVGNYLSRPEVTPEQASQTLERLLRMMDNLWRHHTLVPQLHLTNSYSHLLPVDFRFQSMPKSEGARIHAITPETWPADSLELGDWVCLSGFLVCKVNPDTKTATLQLPPTELQNGRYLVRWRASDNHELHSLQLDQPVASLEGQIVETRLSRFIADIQQAIGSEFEATAESIALPHTKGVQIANPLHHYPTILAEVAAANVSSIHGDLNLSNILIEPETGMISLIDFAEARIDHQLHDLLRLETEVTIHLMAEIVHHHHWPPAAVLGVIYYYLHRLGSQSAVAPPHHLPPDLEKLWAILTTIRQAARRYLAQANDLTEYYRGLFLYLLGALKYKNLSEAPSKPIPKQLAFWGAALIYQFLTATVTAQDELVAALKPLLVSPTQAKKLSLGGTATIRRKSKTHDSQRSQSRSLPLSRLPAPAPLPTGSRMPLSRNPLFVGRQSDLQFLAKTFATGQPQTAAIVGLGGLGKTQLASEFVHRYGRFFTGGVFWLPFADANNVAAEIAACGGSGFMALRPDFAELPLAEQVELVMAEWQRPLPRLLIFDNCEEPELLQQWRPTTGGCHILITSRRTEWAAALGVQSRPLNVLSRPESLALLRQHYADAADVALAAIAAEVGDLPLALHLAGSFLARYRHTISPEEYLERLRDASLQPTLLAAHWGASPTEHVQNISRTIALSYDQLVPQAAVDA